MSEIATRTYSHNFPSAKVKTSRLEDIDPFQLRLEIGDVDIMLASPECTNHTCAKGAAPRSEESKATALQAVRFAKVFRPRWVIMENVVHMRPWSRYEEMKEALRELGYDISEHVIDAADFGVPQSRKRLFLICGLGGVPEFAVPEKRKIRTVAEILDAADVWKTTPLFSPKRAAATLERAARGFEVVGREKPFLLVYYGTDGSGGWQPLDRPLRTITTVDRFALVEPHQSGHRMRMLQVPELTRAMGFTKKYKLPFGTRRQQVHMLGNGVCPPVMAAIITAVKNFDSNMVRSLPSEPISSVYPARASQEAGFEFSF